MVRMSGQSSVREQCSGVEGSGKPSVAEVVSFSAGKNVKRSQFSPSASSSFTSVPTSHRIFGSVTKNDFPT